MFLLILNTFKHFSSMFTTYNIHLSVILFTEEGGYLWSNVLSGEVGMSKDGYAMERGCVPNPHPQTWIRGGGTNCPATDT